MYVCIHTYHIQSFSVVTLFSLVFCMYFTPVNFSFCVLLFLPRHSKHFLSFLILAPRPPISHPSLFPSVSSVAAPIPSSSITMQVFFPPEVQLFVRPQILVEGDDATIYCSAKANPNEITYR